MYRSFIEAMHRQQATTGEIMIVVFAVVALVLLILLRNWWEKELTRQFAKRRSRRDFFSACRERDLLPEEIKLLHHLIEQSDSQFDCNIVLSNLVFDHVVNSVIPKVANKDLPQFNTQIARFRLKLGFRPPPRGRPLSSTRELPSGQNVYIALSEEIFLEGAIESVDETMMLVRLEAGTPLHGAIRIGMPVNLYFSRPGDARYSGSAQILRIASNESGHHVILSHCLDVLRDQRRSDFRMEENRTIGIWVADESLENAQDPYNLLLDIIPETARLEDISAGGALVVFRRYIPYSRCIFLNLDPTNALGLPLVRGTVIRVSTRNRLEHWALSVRFEDLRPSERQKIVRYVFTKERAQLKVA
ncbi:MAG: PilZ domain-containing protein [bacterium]|nr:PilZ domain-containing protein [bacterium]